MNCVRLLSVFVCFVGSPLAIQAIGNEPTTGHTRFDPDSVFRVTTVDPVLAESNRPWVDHTGKHAVVARLVGRDQDHVVFQRADGKRITASPTTLSLADRAYAIRQTEKRVNPSARVLIGKITNVRDGDTIQIKTLDDSIATIRLDGIDAPERHQDFGQTSQAWLARFSGRKVRIEYLEKDRYQRVLGDIYIQDRWVNYEMVLAGLAWHYDKYNENRQLAAAHAYAKQHARGIWQQDELIAPWDYRNGVRKKTPEPLNVDSIRDTDTVVYVTQSGHRYHAATCHHVKEDGIAMPLSRATSAYDRCSVCKPPE